MKLAWHKNEIRKLLYFINYLVYLEFELESLGHHIDNYIYFTSLWEKIF